MATVEATRAAPERYFRELSDAFDDAVERVGEQTSTIAIGPWPLRFRFAGRELLRDLLEPLARLRTAADAEPLASVAVFDTASTGVSAPPFAWRPRHVMPFGHVEGFNDDRFRTIYHGDPTAPDGGFHAVSMYDRECRQAIFWVAAKERIHWYERAEPLRTSISWALTTDQRYLAHASSVGDADGAVLLTGAGGAGKTTTTLACLEAGLRFVADNYVVVSVEREPTAYALYGNAKIWPETLEKLPGLADSIRSFDVAQGEKLVVDVARHRPDQLADRLPVRAVVVPRVVADAETRFTPISPVAALLALSPTTMLQLPRNASPMRGMAALVRRLPCYRLDLGADVFAGPRAIQRLLEELA